jgi:TPR repeat protein
MASSMRRGTLAAFHSLSAFRFRFAQLSSDAGDADGCAALARCAEHIAHQSSNIRHQTSDIRHNTSHTTHASSPYSAVICSHFPTSCYLNGWGVGRDTKIAVEMAKKSAAGGSPLGQYCLGFIFKNGLGVPRDVAAAVKWWQMAAQSGFSLAKSSLERMMSEGGE